MDLPPTPKTFDTDDFFLGPSNLPTSESLSLDDGASDDHNCVEAPRPSHGQRTVTETTLDSSMQRPASGISSSWVAFGSIRLISETIDSSEQIWQIQGSERRDAYPNLFITAALKRGWMRTEYRAHVSSANKSILRIYVLPEDVGRSNRGSIKDHRRIVKWLLSVVDISPESWHGEFDNAVPIRTYNAPAAAQDESLFYIFNTLESPKPEIENFTGPLHSLVSFEDSLEDSIPGLVTKLYPYQKRSVAAMLQREADPSKSQDPRKPLYHDLENKPFYLDVFDGILLQNQHLYTEPRGGILAETMGYGKTLACIALILATRGHYPKMPEGRLETLASEPQGKTPSLLTMAARALKHAALPWKAEFHALHQAGYHYDRCLDELKRHDREFAEPIFHPTTPGRAASQREASRTLRLCYATLVIVPPNLLIQWQQEIEKHTEAGALDLLVLDASTKHVPRWKQLMAYDVILISKARFEQEYRDDDLNQGRRFRGEDRFHSPLTDLRWLRVICDEGHGFAGSASRTNAIAMLDKMSIERRWVVSGTPSSSLHGIEVNLATSEIQPESRRDSLDAALEYRRAPDTAEQEIKDMERLRLIVVNFLKVQPWANQKGIDHANWKKYLAPFDASGKRRCAPGLRTLLQSLIIRHRIEDIDMDLVLPPLHNKTVYLEPSYYDKISMNMFMLVLASNAVTSERTDEDYMHHPKNRKQLDQLISNLRQSSFHWVGFTVHDIEQTLRVSNAYFDDRLDQMPDRDAELLMEAIMNGDRAVKDPGWCAFSKLHEIGVFVENFPDHAAEAWSIHPQASNPLLLGTVQAREAQKYILKHVRDFDPAAGLAGAGIRAMIAACDRAAEEEKSKSSKSSTTNSTAAANAPAGVSDEPRLKSHASPSRNNSSGSFSSPTQKRVRSDSTLATTSPLNSTQITGFTSAKLTYLISRLLHLTQTTDEKSIIFYDANNIAFWLAEALELVQIPFLIYANTLSVGRRASYLATFNDAASPFKVLLMDLKQAAHGLHIASASRVFIISPIWQPSIESQAIKRAHRIGQSREVFVETLVLKGTLEEKMLRRRREMSWEEVVRAEKSLLDDGVMSEIVRSEGFQKFDHEEGSNRGRVSKLEEPVPLFVRREMQDDWNGLIDDQVEDKGKGTKKRKLEEGKRRTVRFGDELAPETSYLEGLSVRKPFDAGSKPLDMRDKSNTSARTEIEIATS